MKPINPPAFFLLHSDMPPKNRMLDSRYREKGWAQMSCAGLAQSFRGLLQLWWNYLAENFQQKGLANFSKNLWRRSFVWFIVNCVTCLWIEQFLTSTSCDTHVPEEVSSSGACRVNQVLRLTRTNYYFWLGPTISCRGLCLNYLKKIS